MNDSELEEARKSISTTLSVSASAEPSTSTSVSLREITKGLFFAKYGDDIKVKKPLPRPGSSFSLVGLEPEKLADIRTYDPTEVERQGCLMFHGLYIKGFNASTFSKLYGDYLDLQNPTLTQMTLGGLWSNLCASASLIHPAKAPTYSPYGLILRVPYQLIYLADYQDVPRTTHSVMNYEVQTFGDYCITELKRQAIISRDKCLQKTNENWSNEIQFVPEAIVDGIPYSVTVTGLWARDTAEEKLVEVLYCGMTTPVMEKQRAPVAPPEALTVLRNMSEELCIPLILSSEWEKQ
jgi:hypothetical protein